MKTSVFVAQSDSRMFVNSSKKKKRNETFFFSSHQIILFIEKKRRDKMEMHVYRRS